MTGMAALSDRDAVRRLLDRFGLGARPGETDRGFDEVLTGLLGPAQPDAGAAATPPRLFPEIDNPKDPAAKKQADQQRTAQERQAVLWWLDRMATADAAAVEKLTWFWHGHFATSEQKVRSPRLMLAQNETFRRFGLGGFTDLARALVVDPAMLLWLDGNANRAGAANENLAREFMELFALGQGHYSEQDVREAARALTGWSVKRTDTEAQLVPKRHDDTPKTIFGGTADFDEVSFVDAALARPESAPFVVGRLWFRLVSATPPPADVLARLVAAYGTNRDIRTALRAIAGTREFRDDRSELVKQPVEWLAGLCRALRVRPGTLDDKTKAGLVTGLRGMGQLPFQPPSVGGWPAGGAWLTTAAGVARLQLARAIAEHADLGALRSDDRAGAVAELLGVPAWSDRTKSALAPLADPVQLTAVAACAPEYVVSR
jgi:uncharacterized protein (DUF1800 family)